jgi:signal transduction histidine kinase/ActR/RegA family two-component response regulator
VIERNRPADRTDSSTRRLLGCSPAPLPGLQLTRQGGLFRIERLLESLIGLARGSGGTVLLADERGLLRVRASSGIQPDVTHPSIRTLDDLSFGLIVHGADVGGADVGGGSGEDDCHCLAPPRNPAARMTLCLPLEGTTATIGAAVVEFQELRSLDPSEVRQIGMLVDHVASACDAERLSQESAHRLVEIERMSGVLEEIDRMKGDFLSMISHELRTPLTAIIGYTDLLLRQVHGPLNERQARHEQAVKKAAHRLLDLINDLLDLNRLEGGHVVLSVDDISLTDAISRAARQAALGADQREVEIRLDLPLTPVAVRADAERLHQVLINLLDNAVKFTPAGGAVTVRVDRGDGVEAVSVIDSGVGVPPDQLDRIWDRFHQADSSTRRHFGGTGLGLAIVRHLVELHGGTVSVSSPGENQGSAFGFTLVSADAALQADVPSPEPPAEALLSPGSRTVLIVDDEPDNREVITSIVQDVLGHTVLTAANGAEALERVQAGPDLVLLDLRMPGMSGFEVARAIKERSATAAIPIIAITALDDEDDRRAATDAGCIGCVTKPFSEASLASAVENCLRGAERGATR